MPSPLRASNAAFLDKPNRLVMLAGPTPGEEYPLVDERLTIGRAEDATISVNHNSVSRLHCEVHALGAGRFEIVDKGSSNGVRVNGTDLRRGIIEPGDVIELGDVQFKFVAAGQIFHTISLGTSLMPSYAAQISPDDRWRAVRYVQRLAAAPAPAAAPGTTSPPAPAAAAAGPTPASAPAAGAGPARSALRSAAPSPAARPQ